MNRWVDSATEKMAALRKLNPQSEMYQLAKAHIYLIGNRIEEANGSLRTITTIGLRLERIHYKLLLSVPDGYDSRKRKSCGSSPG